MSEEERRRLPREPVDIYRPDVIQEVNRAPEVVATSLAPQLGSDSRDITRGQVDMRRFSVISEGDIAFLFYAKIRGRKSRVWNMLYDEYLNLRVAVNGRGRRDIIRMEGVSKGGLPMDLGDDASRPGWVGRNITNRGWKKKAVVDQL